MVLQAGAALAALAAIPKAVLAAAWPEKAFTATEANEALTALLGTVETTATDQISFTAPEIAEQGSNVPIEISTTLTDVESISVVVRNNPRPLAASFEIPAGTLPEIECRIKMGETSDVMAVVRTSSGIFSTSREVKVTIGGCGG